MWRYRFYPKQATQVLQHVHSQDKLGAGFENKCALRIVYCQVCVVPKISHVVDYIILF